MGCFDANVREPGPEIFTFPAGFLRLGLDIGGAGPIYGSASPYSAAYAAALFWFELGSNHLERRHPDACPDGRDDGGCSESRPGCLHRQTRERDDGASADVYRSEAR